jgi:molybdopterin synthase sulfur carrier subunit
VEGVTVREVLDAALRDRPRLRAYLLDEQGRLRPHVAIFVDGALISDRATLADPVPPAASVYVMQALSGG